MSLNMKGNNLIIQRPLPEGYQQIWLNGLFIPSGKIVVGDPFSLSDTAILLTIEPGNYNVELIYKDCFEWGYRVAYALLHFTEDIGVSQWKSAKNIFGINTISVDSGLACIADIETSFLFNKLLIEWKSNNLGKNYFEAVLKDQIQRKVLHGDRINTFGLISPFGDKKNLAVFESGMGDGSYKMYLGLNQKKQPQILVIDFDILNWS